MIKSFTLIEILITTSIILIFGGLSLAYYHNFNQEKILQYEAQKLINSIEIAKKKANSGEVKNCSSFCGYQLSLNNTNYSIDICCACDTNSNCINPTPIIRNYFPPGIISLNNFRTMFRPLLPLVTPIVFQLKNNNISQCEEISINQAGVIESQKVNCSVQN